MPGMQDKSRRVTIVGAGLAGCEAALQLCKRDIPVRLLEMKKIKKSPAHISDELAELVCSNSLKAEGLDSAGGLLKHELDVFGCELLEIARSCRVAAGGALAVDRIKFGEAVTRRIESEPNIELVSEVVEQIPDGNCIVATGPLTDGVLAAEIGKMAGSLSFFDAAAPIIMADSIDTSIAFLGNRYDETSGGDYLNCPMDKDEYMNFWQELTNGETALLKGFEDKKVFEGCMPIEVMAKRGPDTLSFGPLRPVGFIDPRSGKRPFAIVQLRKEDNSGECFNIVGFQTNLKFGEQKRIFSLIPGLKNAEFARFGVMHRNTFINSPGFLNSHFQVIERPDLFFAGQITGVEGYMESITSGMMAGINLARVINGKQLYELPRESMIGALSAHVATSSANYQPMNANFGIIPPLETRIRDKKERYKTLSKRSLDLLFDEIENFN